MKCKICKEEFSNDDAYGLEKHVFNYHPGRIAMEVRGRLKMVEANQPKKKHVVVHSACQISLPATDWVLAQAIQVKLSLPHMSDVFHEALTQYAKLVDRRKK